MLPDSIRNSPYLHPGQLLQLQSIDMPQVDASFEDNTLKNIIQYYSLSPDELEAEVHKYASKLLTEGRVNEAWQVLLTNEVL